MGSLNDHYDPDREGGGNWLRSGKHDVRIIDFELDVSKNKKTPYVRFNMEDKDGLTARHDFYLVPTAMFMLASFAKACGLSEERMVAYDPDNDNAHSMLVNRWVRITIQKDGKYHEVTAWEPGNSSAESLPMPMPTAAEENRAANAAANKDDNIPF